MSTFVLVINGYRLTVKTEKSFFDRQSLKQGYNGQPVKWIKVQPKEDAPDKITMRKHIEHIVQADELQSLYPTGEQDEDGSDKYVVVDKQAIKNRFGGNNEMRVTRCIPRSSIDFRYFNGQHNALNLHQPKKGKKRVVNRDEQELYRLVHLGLMAKDEALIVRYMAYNNQHHAIVYADEDGLRMSVMLPSDRQKDRTEEQKISDRSSRRDEKAFDRLVGTMRTDDLAPEDFKDLYGIALQEVIDAALEGKVYEAPKKKSRTPVPSGLQALFEDSDSDDDDEDSESDESDESDESESESGSDSEDEEPVKKKRPLSRKSPTKKKKARTSK